MIDQSSQFERPVPYWVGLMVAVVVFGSIIAGGVGWAWHLFSAPRPGDLIEVPAIPQARSVARIPPPRPEGVRRTQGANGQISYTVDAAGVTLLISKSNTQPNWAYTFNYSRTDLMTPDQTAAATARFRLINDPAFARSLKVSDDQVARLKDVPPVTTMIISDADQSAVRAAFERYEAQSDPASQQALIQVVTDAANRSLAPTRASIARGVGRIQAILTPEQIKPFAPQ